MAPYIEKVQKQRAARGELGGTKADGEPRTILTCPRDSADGRIALKDMSGDGLHRNRGSEGSGTSPASPIASRQSRESDLSKMVPCLLSRVFSWHKVILEVAERRACPYEPPTSMATLVVAGPNDPSLVSKSLEAIPQANMYSTHNHRNTVAVIPW